MIGDDHPVADVDVGHWLLESTDRAAGPATAAATSSTGRTSPSTPAPAQAHHGGVHRDRDRAGHPSSATNGMPGEGKPMNTAIMISAALVMVRALVDTPYATASRVSPRLRKRSRMRVSRRSRSPSTARTSSARTSGGMVLSIEIGAKPSFRPSPTGRSHGTRAAATMGPSSSTPSAEPGRPTGWRSGSMTERDQVRRPRTPAAASLRHDRRSRPVSAVGPPADESPLATCCLQERRARIQSTVLRAAHVLGSTASAALRTRSGCPRRTPAAPRPDVHRPGHLLPTRRRRRRCRRATRPRQGGDQDGPGRARRGPAP